MTADGVTQFEVKNHGKLTFFRALGLWQVGYDRAKQKHYVNQMSFAFARAMWITWYVLGTLIGIWVKISFSDDQSTFGLPVYFKSALLVLVFMLVGPTQLHIMMRNQLWLPSILKDIHKLESMPLGQGADPSHRDPTVHYSDDSHNHDGNEFTDSDPDDGCCAKFYRKLPKITVGVLVASFMILYGAALWVQSSRADLRDEYKLFVILFYLPFPTLTTWLCITLIKYHETQYKVVQNMDEKHFEDKTTIRLLTNYMSQMFEIFEKMNDHIFQFTLGINFAIYTLIGSVSMFELLQGLAEKRSGEKNRFTDIVYSVPLAICIYHIYATCKASDSLSHHAHNHLRLKLKDHMPKTLMPIPKPAEFSDKVFKKIECLYKDLKYWKPNVSIFGGYRVNYQILTGISFFMFTYARVFIKIAAVKGGGKAEAITAAMGGVTDRPGL